MTLVSKGVIGWSDLPQAGAAVATEGAAPSARSLITTLTSGNGPSRKRPRSSRRHTTRSRVAEWRWEYVTNDLLHGLLVCLRAADDSKVIAGVLELQVVAEHGAVLDRLDNREEVLSAVTKMLDKPTTCKKGALVSSALAAC